MAWGVLEDKKTPQPPGTILLDDVHSTAEDPKAAGSVLLKKRDNIILQPQPSDSPNDPLNWSLKVKLGIFLVLTVTNTTVGGIQGMLGTAGRILAEQYNVSYAILVRTIQPPGIAAGVIALFFVSPIAAVWGKRLPIILGVFVIWTSMLVGYFANSLHYYRALSIVISISGTASELLATPIVNDLIYVHQRGRFMALSTVVTIIGIDATQVISGNIIRHLGVKYLYIVSFGAMAVILTLSFVFVRETTYHRQDPHKSLLNNGKQHHVFDGIMKDRLVLSEELPNLSPPCSRTSFDNTHEGPKIEAKHPWTWYLHFYHGRLTNRSLVRSFLQPFPLMIFPSLLFSAIVNGAMATWPIISGIVSAQVLLYPPYNLKSDRLAYLSLPGSGVALVASLVSGYLSDWLIKYMARRNGGLYEPEFRLLMLIPAVLFSTMGFLLLGPMYARNAAVYQIVLANLLFQLAMPFGSSACTTYILDTMQHSSAEAFVATTLFKSLYMFLATYYVPGWFARHGSVVTYRALAGLNLGVAVLGVPVYMLGKRWRAVVWRNELLRKAAGIELSLSSQTSMRA